LASWRLGVLHLGGSFRTVGGTDEVMHRGRTHNPVETLESRRLLSSAALDAITAQPLLTLSPQATNSSFAGLSPAQVRKAYGFDQISFNGVKGDGSGQTIAIVGAFDAPTIASDLKAFDRKFSLADAPSFRKVSQTGSTASLPAADADWALELSLDVEWAHAAAPKANILLVEAKSDSLGNLLSAVDYARNAGGVSVVSMSWGADEFWGETSYDYHFTTPAGHQGVTFVAASGDDGSFDGPIWPAVASSVLSVGGTALSLSSSGGAYSSERGWSGSGGGVSWYENEPSYQSNVQSTGGRSSPDVSYNADPNAGFSVYDSTTLDGHRGWWIVGGTSAGTPQWAGLIAIADQGRKLAGKSTLNGATQTLPTLYSLGNSATTYAADFHDVTRGATSWFVSASGGYDLVSGLGSPKANGVVQALKNASTGTVAVTRTSVAAAKPHFTAAAVRAAAVSQGNSSSSTLQALPLQHVERFARFSADPARVIIAMQVDAIDAAQHSPGGKGAGLFGDHVITGTGGSSVAPRSHVRTAGRVHQGTPSLSFAAPIQSNESPPVFDPMHRRSDDAPASPTSRNSMTSAAVAQQANLNLFTGDESSTTSRTVLAALAAAAAVVCARFDRRRRRDKLAAADAQLLAGPLTRD
jgi:hypothetical protein